MSSFYEKYAKWMKAGGAATQSQLAKDAGAGVTYSNGGSGGGGKAAESGGQSPLQWGIDIISRPMYTVQGAIRGGLNSIEQGSNAGDAIGNVLGGAWKGLTSTDEADKTHGVDLIDQVGRMVNKDYEAPTLAKVEDWGDFASAIGRGAGGFAADIATDPLTYGTFGLGTLAKTATKGAAKALDPKGRAVTGGGVVDEAVDLDAPMPSPAAAPTPVGASDTAATPSAAREIPAFDPGAMGALNVSQPFKLADAAPAPTSGMSIKAPVKAPEPLKISEKMQLESPKVIEAVAKVQKEFSKVKNTADEIAAEAATRAPAKASPAPTAGPLDFAGFAKSFFTNMDEAIATRPAGGGMGATNIFPRNVIKSIETEGPKALTALARLPEAQRTPALDNFLTAATKYAHEWQAAKKSSSASPAPASVAADVVEEASPGVDVGAVLRSILKTDGGGYTPLGKEFKAAVGDKLARQVVSKQTRAEVGAKVFDDLLRLVNDADKLTPSMIDEMPETVRAFAQNQLGLRREDFDLNVQQKLAALDAGVELPRATNKKTAKDVDLSSLKALAAANRTSVGELANEAMAVGRRIAGAAFDPRKAKTDGDFVSFSGPGGKNYVVRNGDISTHAFASWMIDARRGIRESLAKSKGMDVAKVPVIEKSARTWEAMPAMLRQTEKAFDDAGVMMGVRVGDEKIPLKPSHIYDSIEELALAGDTSIRRLGQAILTNPGTAVPDTLMIEGAAMAMRGADRAELRKILTQTKSKYNGVPFKNQPLVKGGQHLRTKYTGEQLTERAIDLLQRIAPRMAERSALMAREYGEKSVTDAATVATKIESEFAEQISKSEGFAISYLAGIEKRVTELSAAVGASPHAIGIASEQLAAQLPKWAVPQAKSIVQTQTALRNAATSGRSAADIKKLGAAQDAKIVPVSVHAAADMTDELADAARLADADSDFYPLGTGRSDAFKEEIKSRAAWQQMSHFFQQGFRAKYGTSAGGIDMSSYAREAVSSPARDIHNRYNDISTWGKKHNTVRIGDSKETVGSAAWKLMQQGMDEVPPSLLESPEGAMVAAALEDLKPIMNYFFDVPGAGLTGDMYWRSGTSNARYLTRSMEVSGFSRKYGDVVDDALEKGDVENFWRNVEVDNPVEFLMKYNVAVHHALGEFEAVTRLVDKLKSSGLMSSKPRAGFAKPELDGNSFFYAGLSDSGLYVDKAVLDAMSEVDIKLYAARSFGEGSVITNVFDPAMSAWKTGMTIYRPGHHIRNTLSNGMLSFVDQGMSNLSKSGYVAGRILARRDGDRGLAGMSEIERLLKGETNGMKSGGDELISSVKTKNGKTIDFTYDSINDAFSQRGGYRSYKQAEDILEGQGRAQRAADAVMLKGRVPEKVASAVSEVSDHHGYLQHFIQIALNEAKHVGSKYKSVDELYDFAMDRAYKFHPDSSALAPFEAKYMRRIAPFYTWFRGTLPAVIESAVMHPGRIMVAPKASFNIAQTMGIDAQSLANPYPDDVDIPEYMRESVFGPNLMMNGQMYTLNPGFAHQDLASTFFGKGLETDEEGNVVGDEVVPGMVDNAMKGLMSFLGPAIKLPVELSTGVKLDTGKEIYDASDHIDESIPVINYLSKLTGVQFTGNLLNPAGAISQGRLHERNTVDSGYAGSIFEEGFSGNGSDVRGLNWLTGQGAQKVNTSAQAAEEDAVREARKAARENGLDVQDAVDQVRAQAAPVSRVASPANVPAAGGGGLFSNGSAGAGFELLGKSPSQGTSAAGSQGTGGSAGAVSGVTSSNASQGGTGASSSGGTKKLSTEELLSQLNMPQFGKLPTPAGLDYEEAQRINEFMQSKGMKSVTGGQLNTIAGDMQDVALRRQSAMHWTDYASSNLNALAAANPQLTIPELIALLKYAAPNEYK